MWRRKIAYWLTTVWKFSLPAAKATCCSAAGSTRSREQPGCSMRGQLDVTFANPVSSPELRDSSQCTSVLSGVASFMNFTYQIGKGREKYLHWLSSLSQVHSGPWPLMHPEKEKPWPKCEQKQGTATLNSGASKNPSPGDEAVKDANSSSTLNFFLAAETHRQVWS